MRTALATSTQSAGAASAAGAAADPAPVARRWTVLAVVLGAFFAGAGVMRLLPVPFDQALFAGWGVPMWVRTGVGLAELTAGALTLVPRTRAIGAAGIFTIMVAAGTLHGAALDHGFAVPLLVNGVPAFLALAVAWAHRRDLAAL